MRIEDSDIRLSSWREASVSHESTHHGEVSFHKVLQGLGRPLADEKEASREKVARLLQQLVQAILETMQGKKCRSVLADGDGLADQPVAVAGPGREMDWSWQTKETINEHERTRVEGSGVVRTADGRQIDLGFNIDLCRDYRCERNYSESGKVILRDPLVVNFAGSSAELATKRIDFDLDSDGIRETIPGLKAGSGYLVLDRNGNGFADDGSELFGTASGDGFADLAKLDSDRNGWIDEADPAFQDLRLWAGGAENQGSDLSTLKSRGVGAIYLGSVDSQFSLKDDANNLLGVIRAAGMYLGEDGRVGSVQQIDLASQAAPRPEEPEQSQTLAG